MHCKYSKCSIKNPYGFTSADASVPVSISALNKWLCHFSFNVLQEVRCCCSGWNDSFRVRHCSEELWLSCVSIFEDHNGGYVAAAIAVVRSRPHCDQLLIKHELVTFMDKLMRPADQLQVVDVNKLQFLEDREKQKKRRNKNVFKKRTTNVKIYHLLFSIFFRDPKKALISRDPEINIYY